jgi:hypothetical protein
MNSYQKSVGKTTKSSHMNYVETQEQNKINGCFKTMGKCKVAQQTQAVTARTLNVCIYVLTGIVALTLVGTY